MTFADYWTDESLFNYHRLQTLNCVFVNQQGYESHIMLMESDIDNTIWGRRG
jgi:hypothetical protein